MPGTASPEELGWRGLTSVLCLRALGTSTVGHTPRCLDCEVGRPTVEAVYRCQCSGESSPACMQLRGPRHHPSR